MLTERLARDFRRGMAACEEGSDEQALEIAYRLGRDALREGASLGALLELQRERERSLADPDALARARRFFAEILSVQDMALGGYREISERLLAEIDERRKAEADLRLVTHQLSKERETLERRVEERTLELKAQKAALQRANERLQRSNAELRDFAYIASHDMREPIRATASHASMLLALFGDELSETVKERLHRICFLTERMAHLTSSLLEYSRLDTDANIELIDAGVLIEEIRRDLAELLAEKNAEIVVAEDLPKAAGNPAQLRIIFQNLIVNGIKYNKSERRRIEIGWAAHPAPGAPQAVLFSVKDNGVGIDPEQHANVFKIFRRLNRDDAFGAGSGVGLAFVKRVVEALGGEIWVESEPGRGASFHFTNAGAAHARLAGPLEAESPPPGDGAPSDPPAA